MRKIMSSARLIFGIMLAVIVLTSGMTATAPAAHADGNPYDGPVFSDPVYIHAYRACGFFYVFSTDANATPSTSAYLVQVAYAWIDQAKNEALAAAQGDSRLDDFYNNIWNIDNMDDYLLGQQEPDAVPYNATSWTNSANYIFNFCAAVFPQQGNASDWMHTTYPDGSSVGRWNPCQIITWSEDGSIDPNLISGIFYEVSSLTGLLFQQVSSGGQISITGKHLGPPAPGVYTEEGQYGITGADDGPITSGTIWVNVDYQYLWITLRHEIGHVLGLNHNTDVNNPFPPVNEIMSTVTIPGQSPNIYDRGDQTGLWQMGVGGGGCI